MARSVPPGRLPLLHRVPIPAAWHQLSLESRRIGLADCSAAFFIAGGASLRQGANALFCRNVTFRLTAPARRYEPLYVILSRCRSAAANSGMLATPVSFGLTQDPLGAVLLPQVLIPVGHSPSPKGLSKTLAG